MKDTESAAPPLPPASPPPPANELTQDVEHAVRVAADGDIEAALCERTIAALGRLAVEQPPAHARLRRALMRADPAITAPLVDGMVSKHVPGRPTRRGTARTTRLAPAPSSSSWSSCRGSATCSPRRTVPPTSACTRRRAPCRARARLPLVPRDSGACLLPRDRTGVEGRVARRRSHDPCRDRASRRGGARCASPRRRRPDGWLPPRSLRRRMADDPLHVGRVAGARRVADRVPPAPASGLRRVGSFITSAASRRSGSPCPSRSASTARRRGRSVVPVELRSGI